MRRYFIFGAKNTVFIRLVAFRKRLYKEGVKGEQEGLTFNCLSEKMNYEKVDIKVAGILQPSFEFNGTPIPVEFEELNGKVWQDWSNKGAVKLSVTAKSIKPVENKRIKIGGEKA